MPVVFYKGAIFNLKKDNHDLNIFHHDHVIQIWVTRYSSDGKLPCSALCSELKQKVIKMLESVIRNKCNIEMFVKCCKSNVFSNQCMFPLVENQDWENRCDCGGKRHCVTYRDLMQCWLQGSTLTRYQKESFKFDGRLIQLTGIQIDTLGRSLDEMAIGRGTFGTVYRSNDSEVFGIPVAVKKIPTTVSERAQKHARMEMMAIRLLNPFILPLIAFAKTSNGREDDA
ncbi:uncharacterized protein LOC132753855 isoform X2 [Ruditapes philippinarum]|uniref:uncharacterized protein LOC132753855 isoform X2 n=1 Tax=Ruditapes philippinarum TaxID=129788 RepID=UPI00295B24E8|nr:uncharacterized protein LOC132753855 isoform X2 [Ruditapes philippinarum]